MKNTWILTRQGEFFFHKTKTDGVRYLTKFSTKDAAIKFSKEFGLNKAGWKIKSLNCIYSQEVSRMMNNRLISESIKLVTNFYKANHMPVNEKVIRARVENWYCNSDIADAEILAAVAIESDYEPMGYDEILAKKDYYFPQIPVEYDNIHIGETEEALRW